MTRFFGAALLVALWARSAQGAIAFEHSCQATQPNNASFNCVLDGAPVSGETMLLAITYIASSTSGAFPDSYTLTPTFTQIGSAIQNQFGELTFWKRTADGGEGATITVHWSGGAQYSAAASAIVLSGVSAGVNGTPTTTTDTSVNTTHDIPALTTTTANSWDVAVIATAGDNDTPAMEAAFLSGWGGSLTERTDLMNDYAGTGIASALRASAGAQGSTSVTATHANGSIAMRVEILQAVAGGGGRNSKFYRKGKFQ